MRGTAIVAVKDFRKTYGALVAVAGASFEIPKGEILALLGPNGAGKISTLECIEGVWRPDGGAIRVFGLDPAQDSWKLARRVGVQLQSQGLPPAMTARESLALFALRRGIEPDYRSAVRLGLEDKLGSAVSQLSMGQQRRPDLALAAQHDPELLVLDEPTAGLDVETSVSLLILLAAHDMAEAEQLADKALVMVGGQIEIEGSPRELAAGGSGKTRIRISTEGGCLFASPPDFPGAERSAAEEGYALYQPAKPALALMGILAWIDAQRDEVVDLRVERPVLAERFLEIVQWRKA